jgi:tetratricopeptide (TPR) repeat protein
MIFTGSSFTESYQGVDNQARHPFDCIVSMAESPKAHRSAILIEMVEVYAASGQKDKALMLLNRAIEAAESEKAQNPLASVLEKQNPLRFVFAHLTVGQYDEALKLINAVNDSSLKASSLSRLAGRMAEAGQKSKALELLSQALGLIKTPANEAITFSDMATAYAKAGEYETALRTAQKISNKMQYVRATALAAVASECARAGQKEKASEALSQAIQSAQAINDPDIGTELKAEALALIAVAYGDAGLKDKALPLLLQASGLARKSESGNVALEKVAGAYAKIGEYEQARRIAASISYAPSKSDALIEIARACFKAGQKQQARERLEEALQTVSSFKRDQLAYYKLADILVEFMKAEQRERASDVLLYALQEIRADESEYSQINNLVTIAKACAQSGLTPDSRASEVLRKICDREPIPVTPEEEEKRRQVEEAADRFIRRWHETLDLNVLFDEMYVSNPEQRRRNVNLFYGVYQHVTASAYGPAVDKTVDEKVMRAAFIAFWNRAYLNSEYRLSHFKAEEEANYPPDIVKAETELRQIKLSQKRMSLGPIMQFVAKVDQASSVYRRHLTPEKFKAPLYQENIKKMAAEVSESEKPFRIIKGFPEYGVKDDVEVYTLERGVFSFYFVREGGQLKVLTLGFEL